MELIEEILQAAPEMVAIRKQIHQYPEIGYHEEKTAQLICELLKSWKIETHTGLAKTGVVGILKNGASKRAVGLRADMDALPMVEANQFPHASKHTGNMHSCGHDGHITMLLAAAQYLAQHRNFDGTIYFIFQPAEENLAGAIKMIDDGLFQRFPMDAIFGLHNWPALPPGHMAVSPGPVMASCNDFKLEIKAKGGHAAMPDQSIDPLPIACQIILGWQTIVSRSLNPFDTAVISCTMIHAGDAANVISDTCSVIGTVRTFNEQVTDLIEKRMHNIASGICQAYGATCNFTLRRTYIATCNHTEEALLAAQVIQEILPDGYVKTQQPSMASEDFGYMLKNKPGAYAFIGNGDGKHREKGHANGPCELHNPSFDFNDSIIPIGATYWVKLAQRYLASPQI